MKYFSIVFWTYITFTSITAQVPTWTVNANDFQYNMSVTAKVVLDFNTNHEAGNLIGAFVNEELRGVAAPLMINDSAIYFLTIYSNVTSGEDINFQVYLQSEDSLLQAVDLLAFENNQIIGEVHNPFDVNISSLGDFPISLLPFSKDTTIAGYDFDPIFIPDHLLQLDNDPIIWTAISSEHLSTIIINSQYLFVSSNDANWTGSESISIIASENGNSQMFADTQKIVLTILPDFIGPIFGHIPLQLPDDNKAYPLSNLNGYIAHEGTCISYEIEMIPLNGNESNQNWASPPINGNAMNMVLQMSFNDSLFHDTGIIAAFVDGQLAGKSDPVFAGGNAYYFMTLSEVGAGNISFQFYDLERSYLYSIPSEHSFVVGGSIGTVSKPEVIDISPIQISLGSLGEISAMLVDTMFDHVQDVKFIARDCQFPIKNDTTIISFTKNQCRLPDIEICPGEAVCVRASLDLTRTTWFKDNNPIWADSIFSINEPGDYYHQGLDMNNQISVGCLLKVSEGIGCVGTFPTNNYPILEVDLSGSNGEVIFETYPSETIPFEIMWTWIWGQFDLA